MRGAVGKNLPKHTTNVLRNTTAPLYIKEKLTATSYLSLSLPLSPSLFLSLSLSLSLALSEHTLLPALTKKQSQSKTRVTATNQETRGQRWIGRISNSCDIIITSSFISQIFLACVLSIVEIILLCVTAFLIFNFIYVSIVVILPWWPALVLAHHDVISNS